MLIGMIESNLTNMFTDVNEKVGTIAGEVGRTPSTWNGSIYSMIRGLSESVIVPIAGIIITFVLCYELISMITEKNNMHDMDTWMFFKWFFKAAVAIYLVTNTFDIVMAVWGGMLPMREEAAAEVMKTCSVYRLYGDDTEGLVLDAKEIHDHQGLFALQAVRQDAPVCFPFRTVNHRNVGIKVDIAPSFEVP